MAHAPEHVCAALPKNHLAVHLIECAVHSAVTLTVHGYDSDGDDIRDVVHYTAVEFGPFDNVDDMLAAVASAVRSAWLGLH